MASNHEVGALESTSAGIIAGFVGVQSFIIMTGGGTGKLRNIS